MRNCMMKVRAGSDFQSNLELIYEQRGGLIRIEYNETELTWVLTILSDIDESIRHQLIAASKNEAILLYTKWLYNDRKVRV